MVTETVTEFAPAKINLTLHVTGRRADGYHLLDSLVVFAGVGDRVTVQRAPELSLHITGPQAAKLPVQDDNLVLRAACVMGGGVAVVLDKVLPVSSGIGGGSADAAATLRAMARLTGRALPTAADVLALGADVPVCVQGVPVRMTGVGEGLTAVPALPAVWLVLVNPGVSVATPEVFRALSAKDNAPMPPTIPAWATVADFAAFLTSQRNDLEAPAIGLAPVISAVLAGLATHDGCYLARMSGSGATCFGLFGTVADADIAVRMLQRENPGWWVVATPIGGQK